MQHHESISREAWARPAKQTIQIWMMMQGRDHHSNDSNDYDHDNRPNNNHSVACKRRLLQLPPMHMSAYFTLDTSTLLVNNIQTELEHLNAGSSAADVGEGVGDDASSQQGSPNHAMQKTPSGCWWILWWYMSSPPGTINCAPCCAACWTPCCPCCEQASILTRR